MQLNLYKIIFTLPLVTACANSDKMALTNLEQKASYVAGVELMQEYQRNGLIFDKTGFLQGIDDMQAQKEPQLSKAEIKTTKHLQLIERIKHRDKVAIENLAAAKLFLATNAKQPGIIALPSGLQYRVLAQGSSKLKPKPDDRVAVNYLLKDKGGKVIANSDERKKSTELSIKSVIKGWQEALLLMTEGSKWQLFIPPQLAYGENGDPAGKLAPNETLVFDVELVAINPPKAVGTAAMGSQDADSTKSTFSLRW